MAREILHIVIPSFPIALTRVTDAHLRGRPVAVAPQNSDRALLQCVSAEALAEGIDPGMPIFRARRLCPSLIIIPPDPQLLAKGSRTLSEASAEFTPVVEPAHGRVFLDVTASRRLFGPARDVASRLERKIAARLGLQAMAGTGTNKLVSRIAADVLPEPGVYDVFQGAERTFVAPFPVSVLPGVGQERQTQLLRDLNLRRVEELAALSVTQLRLAVGPFAPLLHERACGIDRSPVQPPRRTPQVLEEAFLEQEDNDDAVLLAELCRLVEGCGLRLRRMNKGARKMTLTVNYADGVADEGVRTFAAPRSLDISLFTAAEELFLATCKRRIRVKGLRLVCSQIGEEIAQLDLFATSEETAPRQVALQETLDLLRGRFGMEAVRWGKTLTPERERPVAEETAPASPDLSRYRYQTLTRSGK